MGLDVENSDLFEDGEGMERDMGFVSNLVRQVWTDGCATVMSTIAQEQMSGSRALNSFDRSEISGLEIDELVKNPDLIFKRSV